ncbi:MAG: hypothetical protein QOK43_3000 [Acidimicrobiaceae bacterium]|nr:hypothetical protein [Acidimicrobiaceae bacterium]
MGISKEELRRELGAVQGRRRAYATRAASGRRTWVLGVPHLTCWAIDSHKGTGQDRHVGHRANVDTEAACRDHLVREFPPFGGVSKALALVPHCDEITTIVTIGSGGLHVASSAAHCHVVFGDCLPAATQRAGKATLRRERHAHVLPTAHSWESVRLCYPGMEQYVRRCSWVDSVGGQRSLGLFIFWELWCGSHHGRRIGGSCWFCLCRAPVLWVRPRPSDGAR